MDRPNPRSLNREQLSRFLGNQPDLIRFFEAFIRYLAESVPDAVDGNTEAIEIAQVVADGAAGAAALAQALAGTALDLAQQISEGPPVLVLPGEPPPDDPSHLIGVMRAEIHALTQRVAALEERPTP